MGVPKCNGLHSRQARPVSEGYQEMAGNLDGSRLLWENVFPAQMAKRFHWRKSQLLWLPGAQRDALMVMASRARMTTRERAGLISIQCEASILMAAKARTAARP